MLAGWPDLQISHDIGHGGGASEGHHHTISAPGQDELGVQALLPEQLVVLQGRVEQRAPLLQVELAVAHLLQNPTPLSITAISHCAGGSQ